MSSFNSIEIVEIFFKNTKYPDEVRDLISPFIRTGPLLISEFFEEDLSLELLCRARIKFITSLLQGEFAQKMISMEKHNICSRLVLLQKKLLDVMEELKKDKTISNFAEEWVFLSGPFNAENSELYKENKLTVLQLLQTQPEIFFAL